jgi:hypothetical protein
LVRVAGLLGLLDESSELLFAAKEECIVQLEWFAKGHVLEGWGRRRLSTWLRAGRRRVDWRLGKGRAWEGESSKGRRVDICRINSVDVGSRNEAGVAGRG